MPKGILNNQPAWSREHFTLIELLTVIAIIAILLSLLLPALSRAKREAKHVLCVNNQKQVAAAIFLYTGDNDAYYPDRSYAAPNSTTAFQGRVHAMMNGNYNRLQVIRFPRKSGDSRYWNLRELLENYCSGAEGMREIFVCTFTKDDYTRQFGSGVRKLGGADPKGGFPGWKGSYATDPDAFYLGTYNLYFSFSMGFDSKGDVARPMRKVGERWKNSKNGLNGSRDQYSNILLSDKFGSNQFNYANATHPTLMGKNTWKVSRYYGAGYMFDDGTGKGSDLAPSTAAYTYDDGSVKLIRNIVEDNSTYLGGPFGGGKQYYIPIESFRDRR